MFSKIFFLLLVVPQLVWAEMRINLDISIIHRKGMEQDLTLQNEIHTKKVFLNNDEAVKIDINNGYRVYFRIDKKMEPNIIGPSDLYEVGIQVVNRMGDVLKTFSKDPLELRLNTQGQYIFEISKNQIIEISVLPSIFSP
jgi:plasmid maintenance system killer protein